MATVGLAMYLEGSNELEVTRPGESQKRKIKCRNLNPSQLKVHGVHINGDEIWVLTGPKNNPSPNRKYIYSFKSLSGGSSKSYP
jgi:hypothetical protein